MAPLTEDDLADFLFNYFKAEYAPIRSFFSTAYAEPRMPQRWSSMGHELQPVIIRPANAQAQKDLESLDIFLHQRNLDATFVRGIVVRFAKYELHDRLEKKLYESSRVDLMVRKALKEKHVIDSLWPAAAKSPYGRVQQGNKVRGWYGDMFTKYFRYLHNVDDYKLRPEVDDRIRRSSQLILVPHIDHLVFGPIEPILPIAAKGVVHTRSSSTRDASFAHPTIRPDARADRFEIRFNAPSYLSETHTRSVVRTTDCLKCGTKRDVTVVISLDPTPGPVERSKHSAASTRAGAGASHHTSNTSAPLAARRDSSKAAQKYSLGHVLPVSEIRTPAAMLDATPALQHDRISTARTARAPPKQQQHHRPHGSEAEKHHHHPDGSKPEKQTPAPSSAPAQERASSETQTPADPPANPRSSLSFNILSLWPARAAAAAATADDPADPAPVTKAVTTTTAVTAVSASLPHPSTSPRTHLTPQPPHLTAPPSPTVLPLSPPPPPLPPHLLPGGASLLDTDVPLAAEPQEAGWGDEEREGAEREGQAEEEEWGHSARRVASPEILDEAREAASVWMGG